MRSIISLSRSDSIVTDSLYQLPLHPQPRHHGGVDACERVVGHHTVPRVEAFEFADWVRLEDVEEAKERKRDEYALQAKAEG